MAPDPDATTEPIADVAADELTDDGLDSVAGGGATVVPPGRGYS